MSTGMTAAIPEWPEQRVPHRRRIVTRDGTSLAVSDWVGPSTDRTVVFLHGLCLNQASWSSQARHVLRRYGQDARVISYDHRGHGESAAAPLHTYRVAQLAADLDDVLTSLDVRGPLILVGHSMGAMAALTYLSEGARAHDVAGMVLCATAAGQLSSHGIGRLLGLPSLDTLADALAHIPTRAAAALTAPIRLLLRRLGFVVGSRSEALAAAFGNALQNTPLSTAVGFLASLRDFDQTGNLGSITARTTILSGGMDLLTPPSLSRAMAAVIPGADHIHLPTAGHMLLQEEPRIVNAAIAAVIGASSPTWERRGSRFTTGGPAPAAWAV